MSKKICSFLAFLLLLPNQAFAYLDPGTGGIILSTIIGLIAGAMFYIKSFFLKVKNFFNKTKKKNNIDLNLDNKNDHK